MNQAPLKHSSSTRFAPARSLVTGATSGIGLALTEQLAAAGLPVVALGRRTETLLALQARYPSLAVVQADLSALGQLDALARHLVSAFPDLCCVIHNAGIQHNVRFDAADYGLDAIRTEIDTNLVAPIALTRALLPQLLSRPQAWVVNVGSGLAFSPKRSSAVYSATKAGLHLFTQGLRVQMQGSPLYVVETVMPLVDTPMTLGRGQNKLSATEAAAQIIQGLQAGRQDIWVGKARGIPWLQRFAPSVLRRIMLNG